MDASTQATSDSLAGDRGRCRVVLEGLAPAVDGGRFAVKRCTGDPVAVEVDAFCDGHDRLACRLRWRRAPDGDWQETAMQPLGNDRWRGEFTAGAPGAYFYTVIAWIDHFASWSADLAKRLDPADIRLALQSGADLLEAAAGRAAEEDRRYLLKQAVALRQATDAASGRQFGLDPALAEVVGRYPDFALATLFAPEMPLRVDRQRARYGAWYEMFPRSCIEAGEAHGSLASCERRLPYVAAMGFDVLYLPPIHPIGLSKRKGANNALLAGPDDPGCPWAIGAASGGHQAIEPRLGNLEDFRRLKAKAGELDIELALDIAFQCSPDHPWLNEHPEWFRRRPDGSVQYAENPPKKYEDIYPLDFETPAWRELWQALKGVFAFWIAEGIAIFRVDNPHTKAFPFWEWLIGEIQRTHPDVIFLAEAFTRPKPMYRLAKLGFSQSYTYFTWRNTAREIADYFTELSQGEVREFFRPNLWPNTPDILNEYLQFGGRPAFMTRLALAATLGASYGIYGPAYELMEATAREPGSEEYLDSEKYQLRHWDLERPDSLKEYIARLNRIRRRHPALQQDRNLEFYPVDNDQLVAYGKYSDDGEDSIVVIVNVDPQHLQAGWVTLPAERFGLVGEQPYEMHDLLSDAHYLWHGERNFVSLEPAHSPAHIFRLRRHVLREGDFDYFS
ncbi:MAG: maltotransferase domain-containing protein [Bacteroidota bacterium]